MEISLNNLAETLYTFEDADYGTQTSTPRLYINRLL